MVDNILHSQKCIMQIASRFKLTYFIELIKIAYVAGFFLTPYDDTLGCFVISEICAFMPE